MTAESLDISVAELERSALSVVADNALSPANQSVPIDNRSEFYVSDGHDPDEAERLIMMATLADMVSMSAIGQTLDRHGIKIVDVGAGDSTSLGRRILDLNPSVDYRPLDIREEAVAGHRAAGFDSQVAPATNLPIADTTIDAFHSRFTFGWLDTPGRARALEEMVRAGKPGAHITLIDYDWSVAHGPQPMNDLVDRITDVLREWKFDPNYGAKLRDEVHANPLVQTLIRPTTSIEEKRTEVEQPLGASLSMIDATVRPLIGRLREMERHADADELETLARDVRAHGLTHPDEAVRFPDIVSVTVILDNIAAHAEVVEGINMRRRLGANSLRELSMIAVGPEKLGTYHLTSADMILQARRLHAQAYLEHGYVTPEGIREDGTMIAAIDPQEIVDSSRYIGMFDDEATVTGCIRMIESLDGSVRGLPTYQKLLEMAERGSVDFSATPLGDPGLKAFEGSALGKSSHNNDRTSTAKLLLGIVEEGKRLGYEHAVIGVVEKAAKMMVAMFGEKAFVRIPTTEDVMIKGEGIREEGVKLIPFYVDITAFAAHCREHFDGHKFSSKVHGALFEDM